MTPTTTIWHHTACILCSLDCGLEVRLDKHVPARIEPIPAGTTAS